MADFIQLHNHSHYSILDGITKIDELVKKTKEYGQKTVALTDHGNMFGAMELHKECKKAEIKPIYGAELYIAPKNRFEKNKEEKYHHIVLLAKDLEGYKNLIRLTSIGYTEGFYSKPRIDKDVLKEHSKGLIVLSACMSGELPRFIIDGNETALKSSVTWFLDVFGKENFFLEIQNHKIPEELIIAKRMMELSNETGVGLVATCDSHYLRREDAKLQEIVFAIRDKTTLNDPNRHKYANDEFYLRSPDEMTALFGEIPEAIKNTTLIGEMCNVKLEFADVKAQKNLHTPIYSLPPDETAHSYLTKLCRQGLIDKFKPKKTEPPQEYQDRLTLELELIGKMGFSNYFLIVSDFVRFAKDTGILVGPGRGSAAGALLSYCLRITDVDPIEYQLLFERFLNPERVSMPDIDVDFQDDRRDEVKEYIRSKYGYDRTSDIITFGVLKARASLKDVARVLEVPLEQVNRITKLIDNKMANESLRDLVDGNDKKEIQAVPELKTLRNKGSELEKGWIDYAVKLDGTIRNLGTHASGLIISDITLTEIVPLYKDVSSGLVATQFEGTFLEENGLLKMDILGLSNLTMIKDCLLKIKKNTGLRLDIFGIPLDDQEVFQLFWRGETGGIFQFESTGMTEYLKQLRPNCVDDLIAMNALYRPGPMDNIPSYIARKQGREPIDCFHQNLEPILKSTYGIIVYQEQVMQIAQVLAGFSLGKADVVRRIMAKKKPEELDKIRPEWVDGAESRGYPREMAERIFEILVPFSNYAFNKSHSAAYAILAYQIAYLKTHFRLEFMAALLTLNMSDSDQLRLYCQESIASGIRIITPDINRSIWPFEEFHSGDKSGILFGFGGIKGLGEAMSNAIVDERTLGGEFTSFEDFINRMIKREEFKKGAVEILIKAGAFDGFFPEDNYLQEKAILLHNLEDMVKQKQKNEKEKKSGQFGLFGASEHGGFDIHINRKVNALTLKEDFENEVSIFGFYLSGKLFQHHIRQFGMISSCSNDMIKRLRPGTGILVWGFINSVMVKISSNNKSYAIFSLDNSIDNFKFFLFSEKYEEYKNQIVENNFIMVRFNLVEGKNGLQYDLMNLKPVQAIPNEKFTQLHICLDENDAPESLRESLGAIKNMAENPALKGNMQFIFHILNHGSCSVVQSSDRYRVKYSSSLMHEIRKLPNIKGFWLY